MEMLFIASQLTYLAFVANFGTLITVVFVLGAMILFIRQFRLYEFEPTASSLVLVKKPKVKKLLNKVEMPFSLNLGQAHTTSLELFSRSDSPCIFAVCSDVGVEVLRQLINQPCSKFQEFLENDLNLWPNLIKHSYEDAHDGKSFLVPYCPTSENNPRQNTYALVAFHMRTDLNGLNDDDLAAMITIIHLPDRYCNSPPVILCQYLKCKDGRVLNLKPVYSSAEDSRSHTIKDDNTKQTGNSNCVICWSHPATHVLLPCRHACLCPHCFNRVENCPVCRTRVISYFSV